MKFQCPNCGQRIEADDEWAGKLGTCPACKNGFTVPGAQAQPTVEDPQASPPSDGPQENGPKGFGGWLLIPSVSFIIGIPLTCVQLWLSHDVAQHMYEKGLVQDTSPLTQIIGVTYLLFGVVVAIHFYARLRRTPYLVCILLVFNVFMAMLNSFQSSQPDQAFVTTVAPRALASFVWIAYFLVSERVQNTFTR